MTTSIVFAFDPLSQNVMPMLMLDGSPEVVYPAIARQGHVVPDFDDPWMVEYVSMTVVARDGLKLRLLKSPDVSTIRDEPALSW